MGTDPAGDREWAQIPGMGMDPAPRDRERAQIPLETGNGHGWREWARIPLETRNGHGSGSQRPGWELGRARRGGGGGILGSAAELPPAPGSAGKKPCWDLIGDLIFFPSFHDFLGCRSPGLGVGINSQALELSRNFIGMGMGIGGDFWGDF